MANIERFELPRTDWFDEDGRIYKDALIENFNACEAKLKELIGLNVSDVILPDLTEVEYPDIDENSEDTQIVNLRSFLHICDLIGYPLEIETTGKVIKKLGYWRQDYVYKTLRNIDLAAMETPIDTDHPYVYLDYVTNEVTVSANPATPADSVLVCIFLNGQLVNNITSVVGNVDVLRVLANMPVYTHNAAKDGNGDENVWYRGSYVGAFARQSKSGHAEGTFHVRGEVG